MAQLTVKYYDAEKSQSPQLSECPGHTPQGGIVSVLRAPEFDDRHMGQSFHGSSFGSEGTLNKAGCLTDSSGTVGERIYGDGVGCCACACGFGDCGPKSLEVEFCVPLGRGRRLEHRNKKVLHSGSTWERLVQGKALTLSCDFCFCALLEIDVYCSFRYSLEMSSFGEDTRKLCVAADDAEVPFEVVDFALTEAYMRNHQCYHHTGVPRFLSALSPGQSLTSAMTPAFFHAVRKVMTSSASLLTMEHVSVTITRKPCQ